MLFVAPEPGLIGELVRHRHCGAANDQLPRVDSLPGPWMSETGIQDSSFPWTFPTLASLRGVCAYVELTPPSGVMSARTSVGLRLGDVVQRDPRSCPSHPGRTLVHALECLVPWSRRRPHRPRLRHLWSAPLGLTGITNVRATPPRDTRPSPAILEGLEATHDLGDFDSRSDELDGWLRRHAIAAQHMDYARTFVLVHHANVIGCFSLTMGSVLRAEAPAKVVRGLAAYPVGRSCWLD